MPEFLDTMTGRTIEADGHRAAYYRRSTERFKEIPAEGGRVQFGPGDHNVAAEALDVPSGTVAEVLAWAGDDPDRQAAALAAEKAGKQRKGVLEALS